MRSSLEMKTFEALAIAGSLRRDSFNRRLVRAATKLTPPGLLLQVYDDLGSVPLFNEDLEAGGPPDGVARLKAAVVRADGLLIATPEYNQSIPGVTKNMVDWLSRGDPDALAGKPIAIMGATPGAWGTRLAQAALRQTLTACGALIMPAPHLYVRNAAGLFDPEGNLTDERTSASLKRLLESFEQWIRRLQPER